MPPLLLLPKRLDHDDVYLIGISFVQLTLGQMLQTVHQLVCQDKPRLILGHLFLNENFKFPKATT